MTSKRDNPELKLHIAIKNFLLFVLPKPAADTLIHVPMGGKRSRETGALMKYMGAKPGVGDFNFICCGMLYEIEVKPEGESQSAVQKSREAAVIAAGGKYAICRSIDDVRETLAEWCIETREVAA